MYYLVHVFSHCEYIHKCYNIYGGALIYLSKYCVSNLTAVHTLIVRSGYAFQGRPKIVFPRGVLLVGDKSYRWGRVPLNQRFYLFPTALRSFIAIMGLFYSRKIFSEQSQRCVCVRVCAGGGGGGGGGIFTFKLDKVFHTRGVLKKDISLNLRNTYNK